MESCEGCVGCHICHDPEDQGFDDNYAHRNYAMAHHCNFVIKYDSRSKGRMLSKCCTTRLGLRGRWNKGMDAPIVLLKDSKEWRDMVLGDFEDLWFFPKD